MKKQKKSKKTKLVNYKKLTKKDLKIALKKGCLIPIDLRN